MDLMWKIFFFSKSKVIGARSVAPQKQIVTISQCKTTDGKNRNQLIYIIYSKMTIFIPNVKCMEHESEN